MQEDLELKRMQDYQILLQKERENEYRQQGLQIVRKNEWGQTEDSTPKPTIGMAIVDEIQMQFKRQLEILHKQKENLVEQVNKEREAELERSMAKQK